MWFISRCVGMRVLLYFLVFFWEVGWPGLLECYKIIAIETNRVRVPSKRHCARLKFQNPPEMLCLFLFFSVSLGFSLRDSLFLRPRLQRRRSHGSHTHTVKIEEHKAATMLYKLAKRNKFPVCLCL